MKLYFCPHCRRPFPKVQECPACNILADAPAKSYVEKLLETVLSHETARAGMAVDVLTQRLHEPRASLPLKMLLEREDDPYPLVLGARGLGWLRDAAAVPELAKLLLNESQPFVARVAAAEALGRIGGRDALRVLEQAGHSPRPSVSEACARALKELQSAEQEIKT